MPFDVDVWLLRHADWIQLSFFLVFLLSLAYWQYQKPFSSVSVETSRRWFNHLGLALVSKMCVRIIYGLTLVYTAWLVKQDQVGVFYEQSIPLGLQVIIGLVCLDFTVFFQHRLMHKWRWLWAVHQVHHLDKHVDVTTGIRFHPIEEIVAMGMKMMAVIFLGVPVVVVLAFEILLCFFSLFAHSNIYLSPKVDSMLRKVFVTPAMHRIHHSIEAQEQKCNFGFILSIWDRLFGSYRVHSVMLERKMLFGLDNRRGKECDQFIYLLLHPFGLKRYKQPKARKLKLKMRVMN